MSNCKQIDVRVRLPFDWTQHVPDADAGFLLRVLVSPFGGIRIEQQDGDYEDNDTGGRTAMVDAIIAGTEAIAYPALERLVRVLHDLPGATVHYATARDIEDISAFPVDLLAEVQAT